MVLSIAFTLSFLGAIVATTFFFGEGTVLEKLPIAFLVVLSVLCLGVQLFSLIKVPTFLVLPLILDCLLIIGSALFVRRKGDTWPPKIADSSDVIAYVLLAVLVLLFAYEQYGFDLIPNYANIDGSVHYSASKNFVDTGIIRGMFFARYYDALWMLIAQPFIDSFYLYKAFVLAEVSLLYAGGLVFYSVVKNTSSKLAVAISVVMAAFYVGGYPLSVDVLAFFYVGTTISITAALIWLFKHRLKIGRAVFFTGVALLLFGLVISYPLLMPIAFGALLVEIAFILHERGISWAKLIIGGIVAVVAIVAVGYLLIIPLGTFGSLDRVLRILAMGGGEYATLYASFVFITPAAIYGGITWAKERQQRFVFSLLLFLVLYMAILLVAGVGFHIVSAYYFFKCHFMLWLLLFVFATQGLHALIEVSKPVLAAYSLTWLVLFGYAVSGVDKWIADHEPEFNIEPAAWDNFYVYKKNFSYMRSRPITQAEIDLFRDYDALLDESDRDDAVVIAHPHSIRWFDLMTGRSGENDFRWDLGDSKIAGTDEAIDAAAQQCGYVLVIDSNMSRNSGFTTESGTPAGAVIDHFLDVGEVVEQNEAGCIIKM